MRLDARMKECRESDGRDGYDHSRELYRYAQKREKKYEAFYAPNRFGPQLPSEEQPQALSYQEDLHDSRRVILVQSGDHKQ
jgi:hypothetical protein